MTQSQLSFIQSHILQEFSKPSPKKISELALQLGLKDNTTLLYHIKKLVNAGFLIRIKKGSYKTVLKINQENSNLLEIPYYGKGKCGPEGQFLEEYPEYYVHMNIQLVKQNSKNLFALKAIGDSMEPAISEGDTIIAEKYNHEPPEKNSFYVVSHNLETLIKRVLLTKQGKFLISLNPDYLPIPINPYAFRIVGKVIGIYKNLSFKG